MPQKLRAAAGEGKEYVRSQCRKYGGFKTARSARPKPRAGEAGDAAISAALSAANGAIAFAQAPAISPLGRG